MTRYWLMWALRGLGLAVASAALGAGVAEGLRIRRERAR